MQTVLVSFSTTKDLVTPPDILCKYERQ